MSNYALLGAAILIGWFTLAAGLAACYPKPKDEKESRNYLKDWWSTVWAIPLILAGLSAAGGILYLICSIVGLLGYALFQWVT